MLYYHFFSLQKLALECTKHTTDGAKYTPFPVQGSLQKDQGAPPNPETLSFSQYLSMVRVQIRSAKEIHDVLMDFSNRLSDPVVSQQSQPQPQQQQPQQQSQTPQPTFIA